jgi:hypothetical protein
MDKRALLLIGCSLIAVSCDRRSVPSKASSSTYTAGNEAEFREGARRTHEFEQELLNQGFRVFATTKSNSSKEVALKGNYKELKNVEIRISTGNELKMSGPHFGANLRAFLPDPVAEREFDELEKHLQFAIQGK